MGWFSRMIARLLLGREGADGAARIAESSRQRQRIKTAVRQAGEAERTRSHDRDERARLLEEARATQAKVDREMDPETREKLRETASKLMNNDGG